MEQPAEPLGTRPYLKATQNKTTSYSGLPFYNPFLLPYDCYVLLVVVGFFFALMHDGLVSGTTAHLTRNRASQGISCSLSTFHPLLHSMRFIRLVIDRYTKLDPHITKPAPVYYENGSGCSILQNSMESVNWSLLQSA